MKLSVKRSLQVLLCAAAALFLISCAGKPKAQEEPGNAGQSPYEGVQIGMTFDTFVMERWQRDRDIFVSTARSLGAEVNVQNAGGDVAEQLKQIDYFINKGMDVIVIVAVDADSLTDAVKRAREKGIHVISYDRLVLNAGSDLYISFDNVAVGRFMARQILKDTGGKGTIVKVMGPLKDNNVSLVDRGFSAELEGSSVRVADEYNASEWKGEEAFDYLSSHEVLAESVDGIMCGNDALAGGAVRFLSEKRLAGTKTVTGQDADLDACQRIVEGTQSMTVYKPIEVLARRAAQCAVTLGEGGRLDGTGEGQFTTINDGSFDIPYISVEPIMVTKDNIDREIIDSGFHLKEDVYRNVRNN
ncbi:MAG: substrate-binding domain-containing protein [Lachnospiraceae bacterium]|nr:substrate-binding domain-containing protein [Lachnospiraceae bacterium]